MSVNVISTEKAPGAVGPYSQAIKAGDFLFASGQIPLNPENGKIVGGGVAEQTEQSLKNVGAILAAEGLTYDDVVKTTVYITNMFSDEYNASAIAAKAKITMLENNPVGYFAASILAGAYIGFGILLIFTIGGMLGNQPYTKIIMASRELAGSIWYCRRSPN